MRIYSILFPQHILNASFFFYIVDDSELTNERLLYLQTYKSIYKNIQTSDR